MSELRIIELYAAVADWASATGAKEISKQPGLWYHKTRQASGLGPFDVRINPHNETIDGVPPFHFMVGMDEYFPGIIAIVGPRDGVVMASQRKGEDEAGLIAHFKAQTAAEAA